MGSWGPLSVDKKASVGLIFVCMCVCVLRGFALHLLTCSFPNSSVSGQWGHQGECAAAQHPAILAGAAATQRRHHRIWNQILWKSECTVHVGVFVSFWKAFCLHISFYINISALDQFRFPLQAALSDILQGPLCLIIAIMTDTHKILIRLWSFATTPTHVNTHTTYTHTHARAPPCIPTHTDILS